MRSVALIGAVTASLVMVAAEKPASAGIPDWAKDIVKTAPPVPEGVPEWPERTLLFETSIVVSPDGATWRLQRHEVIQVLTNRIEEGAVAGFAFDDTTKVKKSKGWHIPPGERAHRDVGGAVDLAISDEFLSDAKARFVALEDVKKGSIVVFQFDAESHPYTLTDVQSFYESVPVSVARWSIELPSGWSLKHAWLPDTGPEPAHTGSMLSFERRDLVPPPKEPRGEAPELLGPLLVVALQPPANGSSVAPAFEDWASFGRWFQRLADGRDAATPAVQAAAREALAKAGPAPLDRIRAISLFVRDRVRYLAREVGIGGYQPRNASQVLAELYGDCKDKGTLLRAALQASGFESYPILINATNPYTVAADVPVPGSFNHFIIGVVWPKDAPFPEEAASARVDAGDGGTLLVVDPTDPYAWPGALPENLAGKIGLVVVHGRGVLLTLPDAQPNWHRIVRTYTVTIAADHAVSIDRVSRFYGGPAEFARAASASSFKTRREDVERDLRAAWPGVDIKSYDVKAEDSDGAYVETVALTIPANAAALQEGTFWMFAGAMSDVDRLSLGKRKTAVQYPYPMMLSTEIAMTGAAVRNDLPTPQKASGHGWSVQSTFRRDAGVIHGAWTAERSYAHFEPSAFADLKQFWSAAAKAAGPGVALRD